MSDIHCPMHSEKWCLKAVETFKKLEVNHVHINGDLIDANQFSRHIGSYQRRGSLNDDLDAAEALLKIICEEFESVSFCMGNHDQRIILQTGGEISFNRLFRMIGDFKNLKLTNRSFVLANDDTYIVHPRQYSKTRGKLAQDLAMRHQKNIVLGHLHHSALTMSPCNKFWCAESGTLANIELMDFVQNEVNMMPNMVNGFVVIKHGKPLVFDKHTNWGMYGIKGP